MNEVLSMVLGSMHADLARLERAGMNIANATTVGYKREVVSTLPFSARVSGSDATAAEEPPVSIRVDSRPGTLKSTGHTLDVALSGPGWFEVATTTGTAYTRQGNFRVDARGRLVTQQGDAVMGLSGEIQLPPGIPVIDASGRIFDPAERAAGRHQPLAQLKVVAFDADAPLQRQGDGLFEIAGEAIAAPEGSVQIQQGFLENSNVSHMHEMVRLLEAMRHMETLQKVALGYDEMLATSIRKLGEGN